MAQFVIITFSRNCFIIMNCTAFEVFAPLLLIIVTVYNDCDFISHSCNFIFIIATLFLVLVTLFPIIVTLVLINATLFLYFKLFFIIATLFPVIGHFMLPLNFSVIATLSYY